MLGDLLSIFPRLSILILPIKFTITFHLIFNVHLTNFLFYVSIENASDIFII